MIKTKLVTVALIAAVTTTTFSATNLYAAPIEGKTEHVITLTHKKDVASVHRELKTQGVDILSVESSFELDGQTITDMYSVPPKGGSARAIEKGLKDGRAEVVKLQKEHATEINKRSATTRGKTGLALPTMKTDIKAPTQTPKISRLIVNGAPEEVNAATERLGGSARSIDGLREQGSDTEKTSGLGQKISSIFNSLISRVVHVAHALTTWEQILALRANGGNITTNRSKNPEKWIPEVGHTYASIINDPTSQYDLDGYVYNLMWWDSTSAFDVEDGYEHDFFLDNFDGQTFLDPADSFFFRIPTVTYAASNLPDAYLDTRFGDSPAGTDPIELSFTIGSANAWLIDANTPDWYWTMIYAEQGSQWIDDIKLQANLVTEWPYDTCYFEFGVFCLFGDTSISNANLINWGTATTPTGDWVSWSY